MSEHNNKPAKHEHESKHEHEEKPKVKAEESEPAITAMELGAVNPLALGPAGLAVQRPTRFSEVHVTPRGAQASGHGPSLGSGAVVPLRIILPATQSVNAFEIVTAAGVVLFHIDKNGVASTP
jgi:hypothetical protein